MLYDNIMYFLSVRKKMNELSAEDIDVLAKDELKIILQNIKIDWGKLELIMASNNLINTEPYFVNDFYPFSVSLDETNIIPYFEKCIENLEKIEKKEADKRAKTYLKVLHLLNKEFGAL